MTYPTRQRLNEPGGKEGDFVPDMLVRLYDLPPLDQSGAKPLGGGVVVRRALAPEKRVVLHFVREQFGPGWADECEVSFSRLPVACFVAHREQNLLGFACYDATAKGFFGPTGVLGAARRQGIGRALLLAALYAMRAEGYAYGVIGGVGPVDFYRAVVNAFVIPDSSPGIYRHLLEDPPANRELGQ